MSNEVGVMRTSKVRSVYNESVLRVLRLQLRVGFIGISSIQAKLVILSSSIRWYLSIKNRNWTFSSRQKLTCMIEITTKSKYGRSQKVFTPTKFVSFVAHKMVERKSSAVINCSKRFSSIFIVAVFLLSQISPSDQHGRLIEPPSRASAWRYGFQTPPNYNDHELFCGGFTRQHQTNKGKCGECGDAWDLPTPRPHEYGGAYGQGVTVRKYNPGSVVTVRIELTASHMGYFEFRLCDDINAKQNCLDKNLLKIVSGTPFVKTSTDLETRFYPRNGSRIYEIKAQLPKSE